MKRFRAAKLVFIATLASVLLISPSASAAVIDGSASGQVEKGVVHLQLSATCTLEGALVEFFSITVQQSVGRTKSAVGDGGFHRAICTNGRATAVTDVSAFQGKFAGGTALVTFTACDFQQCHTVRETIRL